MINICTGRFLLLRILMVGVTCLLASHVAAQQFTKPPLRFSIQPFPGAYRIQADTISNTALKNDLSLQVVVRRSDYRINHTILTKELLIPAGRSSASVEVPVVSSSDQYWYLTNVLIEANRNEFPDRQDYLTTQFAPSNRWHQLDYHLFVSSNIISIRDRTFVCTGRIQSSFNSGAIGVKNAAQLPTFQNLSKLYEAIGEIAAGSVISDLSYLQNTGSRFYCLAPGDFFDEWASLNHFRTVFISLNDLQTLAKAKSKIQTLRRWTSAGGHLIVFDCGESFEKRDLVLALMFDIPDEGKLADDLSKWYEPSKALMDVEGFVIQNDWQARQNVELASPSSLPDLARKKVTAIDDQPFLITDFHYGSVVAINDDLTNWATDDWKMLFNSMYERPSVQRMTGLSSVKRNFLQSFRIPGIGEPPVVAFQLLIALFILVIGPGFYFFFYNAKRMHLLLVSTPLLSLLAVGSLFTYAILSDGFATQGRSLSVTGIDHRSGQAITHARHVFYSGVSPRECLFKKDTLVVDARADSSPSSRYRFRGDQQAVSGGQIRARSPYQLTSLRSFESDQAISFSKSITNAEAGTVTNGYSNSVLAVIVHTKNGWYIARNIAPNSAGTAKRVQQELAFAEFKELARRNVNFNSMDHSLVTPTDYVGDYWLYDNWGFSNAVVSQFNLSGMQKLLPENSYMAILDEYDFINNPQPEAIFEGNQLHVIIGKW